MTTSGFLRLVACVGTFWALAFGVTIHGTLYTVRCSLHDGVKVSP